MQTGILVIVTLLVWCCSGSPLCPSLLQAPAWGFVLQGGDLPGPSPSSLSCWWRIRAQDPVRMQFSWEGQAGAAQLDPVPG